MRTTQARSVVALPLPIMHVAPHRTLAYLSVSVQDWAQLETVRETIQAKGGALRMLYAFLDPDPQRLLSEMVVDLTTAHTGITQIAEVLDQLPGVNVVQVGRAAHGIAASESHRLHVAGMPVVIIAQQFLGMTYRRLVQTGGPEVAALLFSVGEEAGRAAAAGVPGLVDMLGISLSPDLIRERFLDVQVFGWAQVDALHTDDQLTGEAVLSSTFEAAAWGGQAKAPVCHWLRGFLTAALSSLCKTGFAVEEIDCQAQGDAACRMVFHPSAA